MWKSAHQHVLDLGRVELGAGDGMLHGMRAEGGAMGHGEGALPGLAQQRSQRCKVGIERRGFAGGRAEGGGGNEREPEPRAKESR